MENLRPNGQRAKTAITMIWVVLILEIISLISGYLQYDLLQVVANGGDISIEAAESNDLREQAIGIVYLIAFIISGVTFIQWFRRAYFNLHLKVNHLSHTEGWAAGSWFVPIINLYRPYRIMKELYKETNELLIKKGLSVSGSLTSSALGFWWTFWILSSILGRFISRMDGESIEELMTSSVLSMILNVVGIPLALITVKIISDYSNAEPLLNKLKDEGEPSILQNNG